MQQTTAPPCAAPDFMPRVPSLRLPEGATDCHAHVIGPASRYPFAAGRVYTPPDCLPEDYDRMRAAVGLARAVLVQPSVYGSDNRLLFDALACDTARLRGVAVAEPGISDAELHTFHAYGVRGLRVNLVDRHDKSPTLPRLQLEHLAARIAPMGWHLELLMHVDQHAAELDVLTNLPVPVVLGHFGYQAVGKGAGDGGFTALLRAMESGRLWVKMTGPYRLTSAGLPYEVCEEMAALLCHAAPHRLLWGSDWPHVMLKGAMPNDADLVELIARWLPEESLRRQVLVDNPQQLYGFAPVTALRSA